MLPPDAQSGDFVVQPTCSNQLRVISKAPDEVRLRLEGAGEAVTVQVAPNSTTTFRVPWPGTTVLLLDTVVLWKGTPDARECRPA